MFPRVPSRQRGVTADRHETWGGMRWPRRCHARLSGAPMIGMVRGRQSCVVLAPQGWRQVLLDDAKATETTTSGLRGERRGNR